MRCGLAQVNVEGGRSKSEQPVPAYPDLCFTVDNFQDAFRSLVSQQLAFVFCALQVLCPVVCRACAHNGLAGY